MVIVTEVDDHWRLDLLPPVTAVCGIATASSENSSDFLNFQQDHFCAAFFYVTRLLFFVFFGLIMMAPHERRRKINIIPVRCQLILMLDLSINESTDCSGSLIISDSS